MHELREQITLESSGQKIFGILHLPNSPPQKQFPAVLLCHGFGGNKSGKFRLFVRLSERLAKEGIASFRFDCRGAGDSEGDFADTTIQGLIDDTKVAMDWLCQHPRIDSHHISILGRSLGGMIAVLSSSSFILSSIILCAPVFDAKPWLQRSKDHFEHQGVLMGETFLQECKELDVISKLRLLNHVPLLHIQGNQDKTIEKYHSKQYELERSQAVAETKFIQLLASDHDFADVKDQEVFLEEIVKWMKKKTTKS
ncbi:MAG: hypothetical protein JWO53_688 [Chlamydiia bacterium]|nr:hypothetical protein [Chlamydiia bacterium]